jgi:agarase
MRRTVWIGVLVVMVLVGAACRPRPHWGGEGGPRFHATGFFRTQFDGARWWFVTPDGRPFYSTGINHVGATGNDVDRVSGRCPYCEAIAAGYPSVEAWTGTTVDRLHRWGFNTIGSWSDTDTFGPRMPYTSLLHMAAGNDWFAPAFADHAAAVAAQSVAPHRDDPNLIGWVTDSELRWGPDWRGTGQLLDDYLALPEGSPGRTVADRHVGDPMGFLGALATRYFQVTSAAIHAQDPNHLILGVKQITQLTAPEVLEAARPYVDVFSIDDYTLVGDLDAQIHAAWPFYLLRDQTLRNLYDIVHKPLMVMEYSFRAADAGVPNSFPPIYPTLSDQAARADATAAYLDRLYAMPWMVGDHWFEYVDEPAGGRFDTEDSNFGLVSSADVPWATLVDRMSSLHAREPDRMADPTPVCWSWARTDHGRVRCVDPPRR